MTKPIICPVCRRTAKVCRAAARGPVRTAAQRQALNDLKSAGALPAAFFRASVLEALRARGLVDGHLVIILTPAGHASVPRGK